jgi:hypothetical protein
MGMKELQSQLEKLPEGSGLSWDFENFFGVENINLKLNEVKVGSIFLDQQEKDETRWIAFDERTKGDALPSIVKIGGRLEGSLEEASKALVELMMSDFGLTSPER